MKSKINLDAFGIITSIACAIHCALLPLILSSLSLFGLDIIQNKFFEFFMIFLALCIGIFSLQHGRKHHGKILPTYIFIAGIFFLITKELFPTEEILLLIPAVVLILTAHSVNYILGKKEEKEKNLVSGSNAPM